MNKQYPPCPGNTTPGNTPPANTTERPAGWAAMLVLAVALALATTSMAPQALESAENSTLALASERTRNDKEQEARNYRKWVTDLAAPQMEGRGIGTKGLEKARAYLIEHFTNLGLKPLFTQPSGKLYTQAFEASGDVQLKEKKLSIVGKDGVTEAEYEKQYTVMGFSPSREFSGQAVFIGYSIVNKHRQYNSFSEMQGNALKGKVAIAFRYEPQNEKGRSLWAGPPKGGQGGHGGQWTSDADLTRKAKHAAQRGAVAILYVNPPAHPTKKLRSTMHSVGRAIPIPMMHISYELFEKMVAKAGYDNTEAKIKQWLKLANTPDHKNGPPMEVLKGVGISGQAVLFRPKIQIHNVGAVLEGSGKLKNEVIVIGAHYDHLGYGGAGSFVQDKQIHPGADDNASGTAGVMMLAQRFRNKLKDDWDRRDSSAPNVRTIVFVAFTGEERGLLGSAYMTKHFGEAGLEVKNIVAMLNMDMIGRLKDEKLTVMGVGSGKQWKDMLNKANAKTKLELKLSDPGMGPSDHTQFYLKNIPVLHFFTGAHRDYHRPTDTADKVNMAGGLRVVDLLDSIVSQLWKEPQRVVFQKTKGRTRSTSGRSKVILGIIPAYGDIEGDKGCEISDVQPGSPADKGKLKGGDVIIGWNGKKIGNLYDLSDVLNKAEPDQKVKIKVKRGKDVLELEVILGKRG